MTECFECLRVKTICTSLRPGVSPTWSIAKRFVVERARRFDRWLWRCNHLTWDQPLLLGCSRWLCQRNSDYHRLPWSRTNRSYYEPRWTKQKHIDQITTSLSIPDVLRDRQYPDWSSWLVCHRRVELVCDGILRCLPARDETNQRSSTRNVRISWKNEFDRSYALFSDRVANPKRETTLQMHLTALVFVDGETQTFRCIFFVDFKGELLVEDTRSTTIVHCACLTFQWLSIGD